MKNKVINGSNSFNLSIYKDIIQNLNNGETVELYINCLGHTRAQIEGSKYREELQNYFGEKLEISIGFIGDVYRLK